MKARVRKNIHGYYVGEVYGKWNSSRFNYEWTGWGKVTGDCLTKFGAKIELKRWKENHDPDGFEL